MSGRATSTTTLPNAIQQRDAIAADFSRAATNYDRDASMQGYAQECLAAWLADTTIADDGLVLDAGSGTGALATKLQRKWSRQYWLGLDIAPLMLAEGRRVYHGSLQADMQAIPLADACADAVVSSLAMQWLPAAELFLAEAMRISRPGGLLALATLTEGTLKPLREAFTQNGRAAPMLRFLAPKELEAALRKSSWRQIEMHQQTHHTAHDNMADLLRSMKRIGARHKTQRGILRHRGDIAALESAYRLLQAPKQIAATPLIADWEITLIKARKQ